MIITEQSPLWLSPQLYNRYLHNLQNSKEKCFTPHDLEYYIMHETVLAYIHCDANMRNALKMYKDDEITINRNDKWQYLYPQILKNIAKNL